MKLSILDQAPVLSGKTAQEALLESRKLAQFGEKLGYTRYWIAEHHDFPGLASSAPEVVLGYIGANTEKIRIGAGLYYYHIISLIKWPKRLMCWQPYFQIELI